MTTIFLATSSLGFIALGVACLSLTYCVMNLQKQINLLRCRIAVCEK